MAVMSSSACEIRIVTESYLFASGNVFGCKTCDGIFHGGWNLGVGHTRMVEARQEGEAMTRRLSNTAKEFLGKDVCYVCEMLTGIVTK